MAAKDKVCERLNVPTVELHNGVKMPLLLLGTAKMISVENPELPRFLGFTPEDVYRQVELSLQAGMTNFDTAWIYRSHPPIAQVLGEWYRTDRLERKDVWITSKIFHPNLDHFCFRNSHMPDMHLMTPDEIKVETRRQFEEALTQLNVGYVNLVLLHWPSGKGLGTRAGNRQRRLAAWQTLEEMYDRGWCRAIGVSNFSVTHLQDLMNDGARITPMVNQIEASVTLQFDDIREYCLQQGIVPQCFSPLGRGLSSMPDPVNEFATKCGKNGGQICLRYLLQKGYSITYMTGSKDRMRSNTDLFDFEMSADDMRALDQLNDLKRGTGQVPPYELD